MAKSTKNALLISIILGGIAFLGVILGFINQDPLYPLFTMLPLIGYEIYRVEGKSTKWASLGLGGLIVAEICLIIFNVAFDIASFLNTESKYIEGYNVQLGDIKVLAPSLMAVLSIVLFKNTRGQYTKLLSILIFLSSFAVIYMLDSQIFGQFLKVLIQEINNFSV